MWRRRVYFFDGADNVTLIAAFADSRIMYRGEMTDTFNVRRELKINSKQFPNNTPLLQLQYSTNKYING